MENKVVITPEQAEAIRSIPEHHKSNAVRDHAEKAWFIPFRTCLNDLSLDDFIKALYIGYEVEPEYSVNDYVVYEFDNSVYEIYQIPLVGKVHLTNEERTIAHVPVTKIRHATPEEKERRMDKKLDELLVNLTNEERIRLHEKLKGGE